MLGFGASLVKPMRHGYVLDNELETAGRGPVGRAVRGTLQKQMVVEIDQ